MSLSPIASPEKIDYHPVILMDKMAAWCQHAVEIEGVTKLILRNTPRRQVLPIRTHLMKISKIVSISDEPDVVITLAKPVQATHFSPSDFRDVIDSIRDWSADTYEKGCGPTVVKLTLFAYGEGNNLLDYKVWKVLVPVSLR